MPQAFEIRHLVLVLGDQLDREASAFDGFDPALDRVWMCEASEESSHVWCSKQRIALFLAAMRHFVQALRDEGLPLIYRDMAEGALAQALTETLARHRVQRVVPTQPGDWRVLQALREAAGFTPLEIREDRHFLCSAREFAAHTAVRTRCHHAIDTRSRRQAVRGASRQHRDIRLAGDADTGARSPAESHR